jgi:hypothetical protein
VERWIEPLSALACPNVVKNVFLSFFCLLTFDLGLSGEHFLTVLKDGNSWIPTN